MCGLNGKMEGAEEDCKFGLAGWWCVGGRVGLVRIVDLLGRKGWLEHGFVHPSFPAWNRTDTDNFAQEYYLTLLDP